MKIRSMKYGVGSMGLFFVLIGFFILTPCSLLLTPTSALAQTGYQPLEPLPNTQVNGEVTAGSYIAGIFVLAIAVASGLAVVMIIVGGIQYMSTDAFSGKNEAKNTIQNAIWGLLLAIGAWLILNTINPDLVEFNLEIPIPESPEDTSPPDSGTGGGGGF